MGQGALGAAGVRCVWAGAGLQLAAYRGGGIFRGFPHSLLHRALRLAAQCIVIGPVRLCLFVALLPR